MPDSWYEVEIEHLGKRYAGKYRIDGGRHPFVYVSYGLAEKSTHVSALGAAAMAKMLLLEIIRAESKHQA